MTQQLRPDLWEEPSVGSRSLFDHLQVNTKSTVLKMTFSLRVDEVRWIIHQCLLRDSTKSIYLF